MAVKDGDMEARIARLEADVVHIRSDIAEMKGDIRTLRESIESLDLRLSAKIDALKDELHSAKLWALLLYVALAAGMYATMARAFGWP